MTPNQKQVLIYLKQAMDIVKTNDGKLIDLNRPTHIVEIAKMLQKEQLERTK